ncbi:hypothetical protein [Deinococcus sp. AJ005]|uniref:hypothetical protein n=1 Tax=Deinococcus sp. AJ005 TaxID=2652443 RepID=UPI00125CCA07|nr:hypothetical protein [Deinococcus sp. AJ005]QFP75992.1 hypothetical protein DAAJ005_05625 [Deinococcus sp. AJ005]
MGAFNVYNPIGPCPNCGNTVNQRFQFKYGECNLYEYHIGAEIIWGGNQRGKPNPGLIALDACGEECPVCDWAEDHAVIFVDGGRLVCVGPNKAKYSFSKPYNIIEIRPARSQFHVFDYQKPEFPIFDYEKEQE